jgi:DNA repair protein RadC
MHENHRARLRERFLAEGLDSFEPHQALEMLLFYAVPRRDTNELAHRLIERFGSLAGVLDAHPSELEAVEGMGRNASVLLSMMKPLWRRYRTESAARGAKLEGSQAACGHAADLFAGRVNEAFYLICLGPGSVLLRDVLLQEGTVDEVSVHPRAVVEAALRSNASQVILAHNHPKGSAEPSPEDIAWTGRVCSALSAIGIGVADHIIVGSDEIYSFAREGRISAPGGLGPEKLP